MHHRAAPQHAKGACCIDCILNHQSRSLAGFKYIGFITETLNFLLPVNLPVPQQTLPIGISFYTFQTISYAVDVYRGEVKAQQSYSKFLLFVSLYHQLVAGPIVRYQEIAAEIEKRRVTIEGFASGLTRFAVGLAKKVCIANIAGEMAARYLDADHAGLTVSEAWLGITMFSVQIYFDFSGYSDMAIGLGRMYGFTYGENFRYPYVAKTATEFWRRWHISLGSSSGTIFISRWVASITDPIEIYLSFGFSRGCGTARAGILCFGGSFLGSSSLPKRRASPNSFSRLPAAFGHIYLIFIVVVSWVLFYFVDLNRALSLYSVMFGIGDQALWSFETGLAVMENVFWLMAVFVACTPLPARVGIRLYERLLSSSAAPLGWFLRTAFTGSLIWASTALLSTGGYNPFLYFRF